MIALMEEGEREGRGERMDMMRKRGGMSEWKTEGNGFERG